ncbi:Crp/Fnr family transcriptional regulator [Clostridium sediminicola]
MRQVPLLSNLKHEQLSKVSAGTIKTNYKKGERIFSQGDKARKLYIVCSGKVKVFRYTGDGKEQILYILSPSDFSFIGAFNLLKENEFDFSAEALEDTTICSLDKKDFDAILVENPKIMLKILEEAYDRINKVESLVDRLSTNDVSAKVAGLLISLIKDFGVKTEDGIIINSTLNREEMGSYAGITRETITRRLRVMHDEGLIEIRNNKQILIKDMDKLKNLT